MLSRVEVDVLEPAEGVRMRFGNEEIIRRAHRHLVRGKEPVAGDVGPHEKQIYPCALRVHESVAFGDSESNHRSARGAELIVFLPHSMRIIGLNQRLAGIQFGVVLNDDHARRDAVQCLPHPIVIAIDVHGEHV
jgi:hypothetical protein